jgi:hypothetical protein
MSLEDIICSLSREGKFRFYTYVYQVLDYNKLQEFGEDSKLYIVNHSHRKNLMIYVDDIGYNTLITGNIIYEKLYDEADIPTFKYISFDIQEYKDFISGKITISGIDPLNCIEITDKDIPDAYKLLQ